MVRSAGSRRGKRPAPAGDDGGGGWDWGAIYAAVATATGWRFGDIDVLSLDDLADLWTYWADHPPAHVSLAAVLRAWGGKAGGKASNRPVAARSPSAAATAQASAMEGVAAVLGPPTQKFRPPCRMQYSQPPAAAAAPSADV